MDITQVNALVKESSPQQTEMAFMRRIKRRQIYSISQTYADYDIRQKHTHAQFGISSEEPWPFSDPELGTITASDGSVTHYPFNNPSGFPTGTPEAYCSAMIYRRTGEWPRKVDYRFCPNIRHYEIARRFWVDSTHSYDAKNWISFLALNRHTRRTQFPQAGHYYVGIKQDEGETGLVVWFHHHDADGHALVSTRIDGEFRVLPVADSDFIWVEIP